MQKGTKLIFLIILVSLILTGCQRQFNANSEITVISREAGSGTRDAFIELFNILNKDKDGNKIDKTIKTADINDSTGIMLTNVSLNVNAIGYISYGTINDSIKVLKINGIEATLENIRNGNYPIARPFNIVTKGEQSIVAKDFINYILSIEGQEIVEATGYIPLDNALPYTGNKPSGKVVIAGSSSVTPLMEKLKEAYQTINLNAVIEIQQNDSSSGIRSTIEGICEIGMASRELKESEIAEGLISTVIAKDGIVMIVNNNNPLDNLTIEQVRGIYIGEIKTWEALLIE